jgi:hypothetical protein
MGPLLTSTAGAAAPPNPRTAAIAAVLSWAVGGATGWAVGRAGLSASALGWPGAAIAGAAFVLVLYGFWWRARTGRPLVTRAVWPALALTIALNAPFAVLGAWLLRLATRAT